MFDALTIAVTFLLSISITPLLRHYALRNELLDVPNARSSHVDITPRGGGAAIVLAFAVAIVMLYSHVSVGGQQLVAFLACIAVAAIGFADDHRHVAVQWRLLAHLTAAVWMVYWLQWQPAIEIYDGIVLPPLLFQIMAVVLLIWLTNLYNFMDGIDGLAASEAICVAIGAALIAWSHSGDGVAMLLLLLACSVAGFLVWNWPPAKIFMGDVGSGFIGITFGFIMIMSMQLGAISFWSWMILLSLFTVDTTVTLFRRVWLGERWYEAHRSHAYQHAAQRWGHKSVTMAAIVINSILLIPLAFLASEQPDYGALIWCVITLPLVFIAIMMRAGLYEK